MLDVYARILKGKLDAAGRIIFAGVGLTEPARISGMLLLRLNPDGSRDATFGSNGFSFNSETAFCNSTAANDFAEDSAGRILVVGSCQASGTSPSSSCGCAVTLARSIHHSAIAATVLVFSQARATWRRRWYLPRAVNRLSAASRGLNPVYLD